MVDVLVVLKEPEGWFPKTSQVVTGFVRDHGLQPAIVPSVEEALEHDPVGVNHVLYFVSGVDANGLDRLQAAGFTGLYPLRDTNDLVDWWMSIFRTSCMGSQEH